MDSEVKIFRALGDTGGSSSICDETISCEDGSAAAADERAGFGNAAALALFLQGLSVFLSDEVIVMPSMMTTSFAFTSGMVGALLSTTNVQ